MKLASIPCEANNGVQVTSQPVLVLLPVLLVGTIVAQLISLAFGRSNHEQAFLSIALPSAALLSAVTLPLAGLGIVLGRQMNLGAPLLACQPA